MLETEARQARLTARYLERLVGAGEGQMNGAPVAADLDPSVRLAAAQLKTGLLRIHPSFRFEEDLAGRLLTAARRSDPEYPADVIDLPSHRSAATSSRSSGPGYESNGDLLRRALYGRRLKKPAIVSKVPRPSKPLIVGGVASAAISLGAIYVAWRWSHSSPGPMTRAVRAAHANRDGRHSTLLGEILGVMS